MKPGSSGCWTCRERKVRCDLQLPACFNCRRSGRICNGRGLRLAWPKPNDKRRAWTSSLSARHKDWKRRAITFVNVSCDDIERFSEFVEYDRDDRRHCREDRRAQIRGLPLSKPISWDLLDERSRAPLNYFVSAGTQFFSATHGLILSPLVLKIALSDSSSSSKAVLHSMLALSCSHLRRKEEAFTYRASAVHYLSAALDENGLMKVAFQNIAASMLLCVFETYHVSETSANWALFLCGTKSIIKAALADIPVHDEDFIALKHWIYYYEVLSRFSLVHWLNEPEVHAVCHENLSDRIITQAPSSIKDDIVAIGYSRPVFEAMSALTDILLHSKGPDKTSSGCQLQIGEVENRLSQASRTTLGAKDPDDAAKIARCYHLAARMYLNRIVLGYNGSEIQHRRLMDEVISNIVDIGVQDVPWPFLIAACEARTEDQRQEILEIRMNKQNEPASNNGIVVLRLVKTFWNMTDLDIDGSLSYVKKMSAVVSSSPFLPVLA